MLTKIDKYRYSNLPQVKINEAFCNACRTGDLELVKYLLLDKNIINAQIEHGNYIGARIACSGKHNDILKFLLEAEELKKKTPINTGKGIFLRVCVEQNNTEMMDYFLKNNPKMNLNQNDDEIFKSLMSNFNKNKDMIKYLIVNYNLPKTQNIEDFLEEKNRGIEEKKLVNEWFQKRTLMEQLDKEFNQTKLTPTKSKKIKV
jgi:hypothetical protein